MATINSAQNGNWNTASTWSPAQVPTTSDIVNISHTVTYDKDDDTNAIGNLTINTGGTLQWTGGVGRKALRIAGNINQTGGQVTMRDGSQIRMHEGFGWYINNNNGSNLDVKGSVPNFETTLSSYYKLHFRSPSRCRIPITILC